LSASSATPISRRSPTISVNRPFSAACDRAFTASARRSDIFKIGDNAAFLGAKAYGEFAHANRPSGLNTSLTFSISEAVPTTVTPTKHLVTK
jgi:hypothetical protein